MRIHASTAAKVTTSSGTARRAAGSGFSVGDSAAARAPAQASGPRAVAGLDALMALQGIDDPTERRRRTVKRGRTALDLLDAIKVGVLEGDLTPAALGRLKAIAGSLTERSGDPGLDDVMAQIELRAAVELAKFERS
jgi:hypothetical protein